MGQTKRKTSRPSVSSFVQAMEHIAPVHLAQGWDNVGLLAGDLSSAARRILLCIDLTQPVVDEAVRRKTDLVLAYHPPIFKPITSVCSQAKGTESVVYQCIRRGIAIYSTHTALDAAEGGTNDVLAEACGVRDAQPLAFVGDASPPKIKLVVFVPPDAVEDVSQAMFDRGAGKIGDYTQCSYRLQGEGTFFGGESTKPAVGRRRQFERIRETRLETIVRTDDLPEVLEAMRRAHPFEEPAYDVYRLEPAQTKGIGRHGPLAKPVTLKTLARRLQRFTGGGSVQTVGSGEAIIKRAVVVAGAAGQLPFALPLAAEDVVVTGEMRHHDALTIDRLGCHAIALGHWASERPVLAALARRLQDELPGVVVHCSEADRDPFSPA